MKTMIKRIFLVLLAALMVLPAFAPSNVEAASTTTYDIGKGYYDSVQEVAPLTQAAYDAGTSNWCLESYSFGTTGSAKYYGGTVIKAMTYKGNYLVFRIKSPGEGVHSLTFNYCTFFRGGEGSLYILDTDTADIQSALIPDNRVGKVDFYNENTSPTTDIDWGYSSIVGSWDFGTEEEYFLVLECSAPAPIYPAMGYMYPVSVTFTEGYQTPTALPQRAKSVLITDKAITTFEPATYAATGMINDEPHIYIPTEGKKLFVYNLETGEKYDEVDTRFTVCRGITVDPDGKVWMVGSQYYLQCYDPNAKAITKEYSTQGSMESGFDLVYGDNGCLYFGSSSNAHVYEFNIATETLRDFGNFNEDTAYACGLAYDPDGYLYAGLTGNKNNDDVHTREVVKIDLSTGECVGRTDVSNCVNQKEIMIRGAALINGVYMAGGNEMDHMLAIDTATMEQVELSYNGTVITNPIIFGVSESVGGKHYFPLRTNGYNYADNGDGTYSGVKGTVRPGLYAIDDATGEIEFVTNQMANGLKMTHDSIISVNGDNCIFWQGGSQFKYYNLVTDEVTTLDTLVSNTDGAPVSMDSIALGQPGSNEILLGAFNNDKCSVFNTETGVITGHFYTNGQTDCMITYNGELYVGNYKDGVLVRVDTDNNVNNYKEKNEVLLDFRYTLDANGEPFSQVRVHALAAGDGKVFAGTMPDSYLRGGCIGWYDTETGETYIERNVVQDQSINSLAYYDGYLYGTTTTSGGTGSGTDETLSAKMFIYDVANKRKVAEIDLRDEIDGLPERLSYVSGIVTDPDIAENGKLWGVVAETLFSFTFDKTTGTYTVTEEMVLSKTKYAGSGSKPKDICFLDGYIYIYFAGSSLFCKINYADPSQYTYLPVVSPSHYVIGEDKNLYYYNDDTLYLYPLNVTDADKTAAAAVDAAIAALAEPITIDSKAAVEAARAAYEALYWDQRALVQNLYQLEEAEADLLEVRIATLDLENLDQTLVNELQDIYNGMTATQRSYVTNYSILMQAQEILALDVYAIGDTIYDTLSSALEDASVGTVIKLLKDYEEDNVALTGGAVLDLNGYTLVCDSFDSAALGYGDVIDSSGGDGLLMTADMLLKENNTYMPLWDHMAQGYRLFAYTFRVDANSESVSAGTRKFWYYLSFESAAAYELIIAGQTGMEIGADVYWNGELLVRAVFGRGEPLSTDTFCVQWAQAMQTKPDTTWLYAQVSGLNAFGLDGTLEVEPLVTANGVRAFVTDGGVSSITYECNAFDFGFTERT